MNEVNKQFLTFEEFRKYIKLQTEAQEAFAKIEEQKIIERI